MTETYFTNTNVKVEPRLVMDEDKSGQLLAVLWNISKASFDGVDSPPPTMFAARYYEQDVWIQAWGDFVVGYAIVERRLGEPYIWSIAVDEKYRHRGIASAILKELEGYYRSKGFQGIALAVKVDNPAQKLYFDAGYRVIKVLADYYQPEGDGLLMRRVL
jgi:ribosomal protein S18 acetylase RimI-like enzyme